MPIRSRSTGGLPRIGASPAPTTALLPTRTASLVPSTEATPTEAATGEKPDSGAERRLVLHELEVLDNEEGEAGQGEEGDGDRDAGGGEPRFRNRRHVEHRGGSVRRSTMTKTARITSQEAMLARRVQSPIPNPGPG